MSITVNEDGKAVISPELANSIAGAIELSEIFLETSILSAEYRNVAEAFTSTLTSLVSHHRNWNQTTGEPDGMYDYYDDDEAPEGAKEPEVSREELTTVEELLEEVLYNMRQAKFAEPTPLSISATVELSNQLGQLATYHPDYDENIGGIPN